MAFCLEVRVTEPDVWHLCINTLSYFLALRETVLDSFSFREFFSVPVISRIEPIGGGQVGWVVGAGGELKVG